MSLSKERVVALAEWWRYTVHTIMSVTQCDHTTSGVRSAWYLTVISSPHSTPAPDHPGSNLAPGLQRSASRLSVYTATALAEKNEQLFMCEDNSSLIIKVKGWSQWLSVDPRPWFIDIWCLTTVRQPGLVSAYHQPLARSWLRLTELL